MPDDPAAGLVLSQNVIDAKGLDRLMRQFKAAIRTAAEARDALTAKTQEFQETASVFVEGKPETHARIRETLSRLRDMDRRLSSLAERFDRLEALAGRAEELETAIGERVGADGFVRKSPGASLDIPGFEPLA